MDTLYHQLQKFGKVKLKESLAKHTTFKIGGEADYFLSVEKIDYIPEIFGFLEGEGVDTFIVGGGSNMLGPDEGYRGVVVEMRDKSFEIKDTSVMAAAGMITVDLARESMKAGLTGFEWGVGVPGTIGGAVRGNAGAMGKEMKDNVSRVEVYKDGEISIFTRQECNFEYRSSIFKHDGGIIMRAWLELEFAKDDTARKKMLEFLKYRAESQPQGFASSGCIFTNIDINDQLAMNKKQLEKVLYNKQKLLQYFDPSDEKVEQFLKVGKISAGWMIEQVEMKGERVGDAMISPKHGNFIVNMGKAKASEVKELIAKIKEKVYSKYEIEIEEEIFIL